MDKQLYVGAIVLALGVLLGPVFNPMAMKSKQVYYGSMAIGVVGGVLILEAILWP